MITNIYQRYFEADLVFNGNRRHGASVMLISDSEAGHIRYSATVAFIPYENAQDFRVPYDAYFTQILYEADGRRSKKKEKAFMDNLQETINSLAAQVSGQIFWDKPLTAERLG